ncbi:MAG: hypothetical protein GC159_17515 [Phycisphaera sp.]|nr:hypothetical protein [Phycisphaera sp.]
MKYRVIIEEYEDGFDDPISRHEVRSMNREPDADDDDLGEHLGCIIGLAINAACHGDLPNAYFVISGILQRAHHNESLLYEIGRAIVNWDPDDDTRSGLDIWVDDKFQKVATGKKSSAA